MSVADNLQSQVDFQDPEESHMAFYRHSQQKDINSE